MGMCGTVHPVRPANTVTRRTGYLMTLKDCSHETRGNKPSEDVTEGGIRQDGVSMACLMHWRYENCIERFSRSTKWKELFERPRRILKDNIKVVVCGLDLSYVRWDIS